LILFLKELSFVNVNIVNIKDELIRKIKEIVKHQALKNRLKRIQKLNPSSTPARHYRQIELPKISYSAIALGISTGGPFSLQKIIPVLSNKIKCPIFIVQHMPPKFTKSLADRLDGLTQLEVKEAEDDETVRNGVVYIAPGGYHMTVVKNSIGQNRIRISDEPATTLNKPSVDIMTKSVIDIYGKYTLGVIMTGMGKDGLKGISKLKSLGGYCIAQDEKTCVVYGMPKSIVDAELADVIAPLEKIPRIINEAVVNEK